MCFNKHSLFTTGKEISPSYKPLTQVGKPGTKGIRKSQKMAIPTTSLSYLRDDDYEWGKIFKSRHLLNKCYKQAKVVNMTFAFSAAFHNKKYNMLGLN